MSLGVIHAVKDVFQPVPAVKGHFQQCPAQGILRVRPPRRNCSTVRSRSADTAGRNGYGDFCISMHPAYSIAPAGCRCTPLIAYAAGFGPLPLDAVCRIMIVRWRELPNLLAWVMANQTQKRQLDQHVRSTNRLLTP